jgi:hypothetical protein
MQPLEPLDYERPSTPEESRECQRDLSGALCIIGAGLFAIAGAIIVGLAKVPDVAVLGLFVLAVAVVILAIGIIRFFAR